MGHMKIGILTYYGDLNCGTNLQAYATLKAVRVAYPHDDVEIIPIHGFRQYKHPYLSECTPISLYKDLIRINKYCKFHKHLLGVKKDHTILSVDKALRYIDQQGYDIIFVGADTLLELNRLPKEYDGLSLYWLSTRIKAKIVLLAASSKNVEYDNLSAKQKSEMEQVVRSYAAIGVRDTATRQLLSHYVDEAEIEVIPDPTFSLPIDYSHTQRYIERNNLHFPEKCICLHCYKTDSWAGEVAQQLKKEGYTVVSLRPAKWADIVLNDMSPLEQAGIFRHFNLIVTHRFHEGIYALKNSTPPLLYVNGNTNLQTQSGESKYKSLMSSVGLYESNVIDSGVITAQRILTAISQAMETFARNKALIEENVREKSSLYNDFLQRSKNKIEKSRQ